MIVLDLLPGQNLALVVTLRGFIDLEVGLASVLPGLQLLLPQALPFDGHGLLPLVPDLAHHLGCDLLDPLDEWLREKLALLVDGRAQYGLDAAYAQDRVHPHDFQMIPLDQLLRVPVLHQVLDYRGHPLGQQGLNARVRRAQVVHEILRDAPHMRAVRGQEA